MIIVSEDNYLHIKELQIHNLYQWKWYWTIALNFIENFSKEILTKWIRLTVFKDNPAIKLYKRMWFIVFENRFDGKAYYMEKYHYNSK